MEERLQKLLSSAGVTSRREAERWITDGRVTVNGTVATLGDKADLNQDAVCVDGKPLVKTEQRTYIMLHKPRGFVTTLSDDQGRKTVADLVADCGVRLWPVGRLDLNSEGLLLLTDDGEFTHKILHPSHEVEKEYLVWVSGEPKALECCVERLSEPMILDGDRVTAVKVKSLRREADRAQILVTIRQGKNRQVRRMCNQAGLSVARLKRVREGNLVLDKDLAPGAWRPLTQQEVKSLLG